MPQESSQSNIGVKRYGQNTNTSQNISMPGLFPSLALTNLSLSFMLPHISNSLNSSKASSQLGFTLEFS